MKKIICIVVLFLFPISNFAQKRHNISYNIGNYIFIDVLDYQKRNFFQSGLQNEYNLHKKWNINFGVSGAFRVWDVFSRSMVKGQNTNVKYLAGVNTVDSSSVGKLIIHNSQTNFDIGSSFDAIMNKRNRFSVYLGLSFSTVKNEYLASYFRYPKYNDFIFTTRYKTEFYMGG